MDNIPIFQGFKKIPRLSREIIITEKIDGTCGLIYVDEANNLFVGSKNRWLDDHTDNFNFWHWVMENKEELLKLGKGYHYGEWWGKGIQRGYNLEEKRFSLFNTGKWVKKQNLTQLQLDILDQRPEWEQKLKEKQEYCPECCYVVPILYEGMFNTSIISSILDELRITGSKASPNFMKPEGIVIYHKQGNIYFKKTIENDEKGKNE